MDYVNKKEFEAAIAIIKRALKNEQIIEGRGSLPLDALLFAHAAYEGYTHTPEQVTFTAPDLAAKNKLHSLREKLKISRKDIGDNQKALEKLESEEKALAALLPALKE